MNTARNALNNSLQNTKLPQMLAAIAGWLRLRLSDENNPLQALNESALGQCLRLIDENNSPTGVNQKEHYETVIRFIDYVVDSIHKGPYDSALLEIGGWDLLVKASIAARLVNDDTRLMEKTIGLGNQTYMGCNNAYRLDHVDTFMAKLLLGYEGVGEMGHLTYFMPASKGDEPSEHQHLPQITQYEAIGRKEPFILYSDRAFYNGLVVLPGETSTKFICTINSASFDGRSTVKSTPKDVYRFLVGHTSTALFFDKSYPRDTRIEEGLSEEPAIEIELDHDIIDPVTFLPFTGL